MTRATVTLRPVSNLAPVKQPSLYPPQHQGRSREAGERGKGERERKERRKEREGGGKQGGMEGRKEGGKVGGREGRKERRDRGSPTGAWLGRAEH